MKDIMVISSEEVYKDSCKSYDNNVSYLTKLEPMEFISAMMTAFSDYSAIVSRDDLEQEYNTIAILNQFSELMHDVHGTDITVEDVLENAKKYE